MGCCIYARSILGVKLPKPPFRDVKKRGCSHDEAKSVFCGECAAKTWITESEPIPGYDPDSSEGKFGRFVILEGCCSESPEYYVGKILGETSDLMYSPPGLEFVSWNVLADIDITAMKADLQTLLEIHGLWDGKFGIHTFGFTSV